MRRSIALPLTVRREAAPSRIDRGPDAGQQLLELCRRELGVTANGLRYLSVLMRPGFENRRSWRSPVSHWPLVGSRPAP